MRAFLQFVLVCAAVGGAVVAVATVQPASSVTTVSVMAGSQAKARGAELFATRGCAHCHGPAGVGGAEGPDLQLVRKRLNQTQIFMQIHNGGKSMPPYGDSMTSAEIDDLVAYLRARRKVIAVPPKPSAEAAPSDPNG